MRIPDLLAAVPPLGSIISAAQVSRAGAWTTGQTIIVDGGPTCRAVQPNPLAAGFARRWISNSEGAR